MRAIFSKVSIQSQPESASEAASLGASSSGGLEHNMSKADQVISPGNIQSIHSSVQLDHTEGNSSSTTDTMGPRLI